LPLLTPIADYVRSRPILRRCAHVAVRLIPDVPWTVRVPELGPLRIRLRQHRWHLWEQFDRSDTLMWGTFDRLISPGRGANLGDVVYDIGANIGKYSRVMVQLYGASRLLAFEPMTENYELLLANIRLGNLEGRIVPFHLALGDVEGEEDLQIDDMNSGSAVLSSVSGGAASEGRRSFGLPPLTERIKVVRLDDLIGRESLPPPNFMKIDTEGAEVKVLTGAKLTLLTQKPHLAIALHGIDKARDTIALLNDLGYAVAGFVADPDSKTGGETYRFLQSGDAAILSNNNIVASREPALIAEQITRQPARHGR
jgi:FkbM family methyltransferase